MLKIAAAGMCSLELFQENPRFISMLEGDYMRPGWTQTGTKADRYNDITWDRDESREWLHEIGMKKSFIYKIRLACCTLAADHFATSQTIMDVRQLQDMCFAMLVSATACVILLNAFPALLSPFWEQLQTFAHARSLTQCSVGAKTQTGLKIFAITCRPGPKLTRSEIFGSVYLPKRVAPVWVEFLYRSHVIR